MNEEVNQSLDALMPALRTLQRSLEQIQASGSTAGSGRMALRHYRLLHEQITRLLPEDRYITEGLAADVDENAPDETLIAQMLLLIQQLYVYTRSLIRETSGQGGASVSAHVDHAGHAGGGPKVRVQINGQDVEFAQQWREFAHDYRRFGRELRDQIMHHTRDTLRSTMANVQHDVERAWSDWDAERAAPPVPPVPPTPPTPPVPPVPPTGGKRRIHIDLDDDSSGPFEDFPDPNERGDKPPTI